jgi:predicted RNA-binding Zn ribbon-like protein
MSAKHPMLTRLKRDLTGTTTESWFVTSQPQDLLAPLAHSVANLFATADRSRVRKCGNCVLHFYDTSKKGTRQWCSMQLCGNRLKVAAYAARQRARTRR